MMQPMRSVVARRLVLLGAVAFVALDVLLVACSDELPPGAGSSSGDSPIDASRPEAAPTNEGGSFGGDASDGGTVPDDGGGGTDTGAVDTGPPFTCIDDRPLVVDGGTAPSSCPGSASCSGYCDRIRMNYKLGVAQDAIQCLVALPSCANQAQVLGCVDRAVDKACTDGTTKGYCTPLVTACDPNAGQPGSNIDQAGCEALAKGLGDAGRGTFATCVDGKTDAGTCPNEVGVCSEAVRL